MKSTSAPASAAASPRRSASSRSTAEIASVRAMIIIVGSVRASTAARILPTNSPRGTTWCPARWPQRLGVIWSSMWSAATPAASYVCTVRRTFSAFPYPVSASAMSGTSRMDARFRA